MSEHDSTTPTLTLNIQYHTIQGSFVPTVDGRELHARLGSREHFTDWIIRRIEEYIFLPEIDYLFIRNIGKTPGRPGHQYILTLDMAKELCMVERTSVGRAARQYFIACERAALQGYGRIEQRLDALEAGLKRLETPTTSDQLTPRGQLPAPTPRVREHAEVSWHLAAAWALLRDSRECLTNQEIALRTGIAARTARAHTRYLLQLGMLDLHETFPRHLYVVAEQADKRNTGVYQRLNRLTEIIRARSQY